MQKACKQGQCWEIEFQLVREGVRPHVRPHHSPRRGRMGAAPPIARAFAGLPA